MPPPAQEGNDKAMSNQEPANPTRLPIAVYANIGPTDNLIPVKCFATFAEAEAWKKQMEIERPGYYDIDCAYESDYYE